MAKNKYIGVDLSFKKELINYFHSLPKDTVKELFSPSMLGDIECSKSEENSSSHQK